LRGLPVGCTVVAGELNGGGEKVQLALSCKWYAHMYSIVRFSRKHEKLILLPFVSNDVICIYNLLLDHSRIKQTNDFRNYNVIF
jgi:hypothetical protein